MSKTSLNRQIIWYLSRVEISIVFVASIFENERNFSQKILTFRRKKNTRLMIVQRNGKTIFFKEKKFLVNEKCFLLKKMKKNKNEQKFWEWKKIFFFITIEKKTKWVVYKRWTNLYQKVCKLHIRNYLCFL